MADSEETAPMREGDLIKKSGRKKYGGQSRSEVAKWKIISVVLLILAIALTAALIAVAVQSAHSHASLNDDISDCGSPLQHRSTELLRRSKQIFSGLTTVETEQVVQFLLKQEDLKLVPASEANLSSNYIFSIESYLPNKKDVVDWLDELTDAQPIRKAKAILYLGQKQQVGEYLVWPIPTPNTFTAVDGKRPSWKSRPICNTVEIAAILKFLNMTLQPVKSIIINSFTPSCRKPFLECIHMNLATRSVFNSDDRHFILWFNLMDERIDDYYLYPLPFEIILASHGTDFRVVNIYYNNLKFSSVQDLINKFNTNTSVRFVLPDITENIGRYGSPKYIKDGETIDQVRRPPAAVYPDGQRYSVDNQHVQWLKWTFNIHPNTLTGMQILDVRFKGERIAYEMGAQDILVMYSGTPPHDFFRNWFDVGWGMGRYNMPLMRDVDCPPGATYLDSTVYALSRDSSTQLKDAICIFEHRNSIPLRRHYSASVTTWGYNNAFSMPDTVLIVRQMLTLWNYDYIYDYEFHQNGVIEIKVSSTGYIASSKNLDPRNSKHGYVIDSVWNLGANLHQHIFNFKIDLDVGGTTNRFKTLNIKSEPTNSPYQGNNEWYQMVMDETVLRTEKEALVHYNFSEPKQFIVYNALSPSVIKSSTLHRGYRVVPNGLHNVAMPKTAPLLEGGGSWAKYQLAVTKHNENERGTASYYTQADPFNPHVNFDNFVADNEGIVDADIVLWATVGMHHIPTTEDLPVTFTTGKTLGVILTPFNYFERDPSISSRDAVTFWSKPIYGMYNDFLQKNDTCPAQASIPKINIQ